MTRRRLTALVVLAVTAVAVIAGVSACGGDDEGAGYKVRAMFFNAFTVIPGADVKSAGVVIGKIESLDVEDRKAAIVLNITDPAFQDFRDDALCQIRPQSLIGERFIECQLTKKRAAGSTEAPKLKKIEDGPGKGQYLLPATNTVNPIDLDLVNNTLRLPYRQRLTIILNELGVGLAGNGKALRTAVRAANPTLRSLEDVIAIFAEQNKVLAQIADDGDRALQPIAAQADRVAGAIESMNTVAQATAERSDPLEQGLQKLPATLREVRPTMAALNDLAEQLQPVADDLKTSGKDISRTIVGLGDAAAVGTEAFESLADTLDVGRDALLASTPILEDGREIGKTVRPGAKNLADLTTSLKETYGIDGLMQLFYFTAMSTNGYDEDGHYLRSLQTLNTCVAYQKGPCTAGARFTVTAKAPPAGQPTASAAAKKRAKPVVLPSAVLPGADAAKAGAQTTAGGGKTTKTDGREAVLDYLMGD